MAWKSGSAAALRNRNEKERQEKTVMATAAGGAEPLSQRKSADSRNSLDLGSTGTSWAKGNAAALRAQKQQEATSRQTGTDLYSTALEDYRTRNNLGFADTMDSRSDELNRQKVTVSPAGNTLGTWYGQQAQKLKNSYAEYSQPEAFDQANQWFDQPRNQELVNKLLEKKSNYTSYAETGTSRNGASAGDGSIDPFRTTGIKGKVGNTYSTADLKKLGYTDTEIRQAREYLDTMEEIPEWKQLARRTANTVAAAPLMGAEYLVQAGKNIRQSSENRKALEAELARNPREKNLYDQLMETDMDYQPKYSTGNLLQQGFTRQEIEDMRSRIAGTEAKGGIDTEKSVGYQLYNRGQQLTGAAQSGLTDVQRTVQGVATSAAENLAVAAINPAAVLPVLSAQGAADAMGKSAAKGESAGKALAGGVAKFGAGWAINSVGAADLARTMGADYARNSVAGAVADKIRALAGDSAFAAAHPAVANAISGGIDNAVQAFVETYADKAIDAALGDSEAAQTMFTTDTLVQALEAGLTGGASGALGGAVGTGLSRMNAGDSSLRGNVERYAAQDEYEQALKEHQRREELAREPGEVDGEEPLSHALRDSYPDRATTTTAASGGNREELLGQRPAGYERSEVDAGSRNQLAKLTLQAQTETAANQAAEGNSAETAAISDNLAVQTFAEAAAGDSLTGKTIRLFTPEAGNEANRAAFEEAYGVKLPSTAAATRRMLREVAAQRSQQNAVENAGEMVESSREAGSPSQSAQSAASSPEGRALGMLGSSELDAEGRTGRKAAEDDGIVNVPQQAVMQAATTEESALGEAGNSPMRETYGMEAPRTEGQKQARTEQVLRSWKVGEKAAQEISRKQPEGVDSDRYAAAASTLYRLGQMEDVKTFDQALELAGTGSGMAANVNYVLGNLKGRNALEIAYTYGRDAAETRWAKSQLGGTLTEQSLTGRGETIYKGTLRNANDAGSQVIELNAAATGTTAVLKNVLQNSVGQADSRVRAYVDTETARIFFGDSAQDTFGTVLHEDYHWYNALDSEGAKTLQDHALLYLARSSGFETVDEMIREKMADYAQQNLTYEEAAEELVGDAWRGIFSNESDFKRWVEFQRGQAEKNSGRAGTIRTVMNRVKEMLGGIISRAKEVLTLDPDNRAAMKAQRLAENERRILQDEYFAHAEKAMDNLRSAKENAAALKTESAAEGRNIRFSIQKDADGESYIKIDEDILNGVPREEWKTVVKQAIKERYPNGFERNGWTILNHKDGRSEFVRSKSTMALQRTNEETYADKMRMAANLDEIIKTADEVYREPANHKNAEAFNRGKIKIVVGQNAYEADVLTAFKANDREIFYDIVDIKSTNNKTSMRTHVESKDSRSSLQGGFTEPSGKAHMESEDSGSRGSEGSIYQESADTVLKTEEGGERPSFPAKNSIAQENSESKGNSEPVKKSVRFQLSDGSAGNVDELAALQKESRELEHQQNALKTERTNWLNSAEVKEIEAKRKSLGLFSAEAKEFKASEEYQAYLAKRKDFNQRGAELENRIGEVNNALREAHAKLETQRNEQKQKQQAVYDAKAKEAGGAAKYRRQLAVEQFGTTSEFERAGYILPDGQMLDFARNDKTRDTDHREIMSVFGPAEVSEGTDALNKFLADGNVRVMAEAPGVDLAADKAPTAAQLEQIREMAGSLGSEQRKFTLDISTTDGRVAASKEYSGRIDADRVVREIRDYYKTGELPAESSLARFRYQLAAKAEQAERDARKNTQRQASRAIADNSAAMETLAQMMGVTHGVRISQDSIDGLAVRWTKANGSRADRTKIAGETRALVEYMTADGASMSKASALSETIADEILSGATYRNTELWDEYPEYHDLSYTVNKDGPAKAELVKRYGTWSEAVAEARKHGVKLRQAEGVRDGNPAEVYEAIVNDTRAMGGTKEGAAALFRGAAQAAGVDGAASMESTEWLDVLMNVHDAIKPRMMSRFADAAEYEDAKVELADRMLGDILNVPEMTDAQAIFDGFQRWQRQAVAAAVGEENAEQALKDLRKVQKEQNREFNRRMYENSRNQAVNRYAEENPGAGQRELKNVGDMNEFLTFNREEYERRLRTERQRLKMERQQMLDEITLEFAKRENELNIENDLLAHEYAKERARADYAERQLMVQDQEIADWEEENRKKAAQWEKLQKERDRKAEELWNDFADKVQEGAMSEIAKAAKANELSERRAKLAREGRQKDELKRAIRNNATQLNQMVLRPAKDKYVQPRLILRALEVAKLADMTFLNQNAVNRLDALANSIRAEYGDADHPVVTEMSNDWEKSGIANLIDALKDDLSASKEAQLDRLRGQLAEAEALEDSQKTRKLRSRLEARIKDVENKPYLPMTVDQMRMLKAITTSTLHVIRTANKTLSLQQAEAVDKIAGEAAVEVNRSKGNDGKFRRMLTRYNLDMLGGTRVFRMLGGYAKNSQMEKLGTMLNDGQREQTRITVEGTKLFDNVTGKANLRQMEKFAGPGAELVDIGLKDSKGRAAPLTHAQLCSLYMHLQNADSREHLLNGGLTIPDAEEYNRGDIEKAYQKGQTVKIGMLTDSTGNPMADTVIQAVEKAMTDYDRAWCEDMKNFFGSYTTNLINETSMKLLGYQRATVRNYYPIAVDKTALATQIEGVKLDATIEGRGFLKNRVKSQMPILLEECSSVVQRSLRDTAAYAGLAAPIRDVQKVLNSGIETEDGIKMLKNGILKEQWGQSATNYIDDLLTDLQTTQRKRSTTMTKVLDRLRGNYAGAILTLNPGVAIAQAASLPTAGAVLGADTMAAVVPFVKNFSPKQRAALEAEITEHGDVLLRYRLRGSQRGELASIGVSQGAAEKAMDKLPKWVTGWINSMDEITVAALWEGSKRYVEHHTNEFAEGAATKGSEAYWEAVNKMYQRVIEETQPNYTTMQRAGIQRNPDQMTKTLTMFTTQRFQNYGILADAVMDYNAQKARDKAAHSSETAEEVKRAGKNLNRAIVSQITQTAVFALMKIGADFLLHRWDREQDENGDVTAASVRKRFLNLYTESFAGNFLYGSELYSAVGNAVNGTDYDVVSATNISAVNDLFAAVTKFSSLVRQDTGDMTEEQLEAYHQKLRKTGVNLMQYGFEIAGVPMGNARKMLDAFDAYVEDARDIASGSGFSFSSTPTSATGQYDRLYNAIAEGDTDNASGAMAKLEAMGKDEKTIASQLKNRLKKYSPEVEQAARARNEGKDSRRQELTKQLVREMYETLGIREGVKADAEKRTWVIDLVTGAINQKADSLLAGDKDRTVYSDLTDALETGKRKDVQDKIDRLRTAGKADSQIKSKITDAVKEEYLAGNDHDREQLEQMLLKLEKADGSQMYEEKNFAQWVKDAAKKEEQVKNSEDEWAGVR